MERNETLDLLTTYESVTFTTSIFATLNAFDDPLTSTKYPVSLDHE